MAKKEKNSADLEGALRKAGTDFAEAYAAAVAAGLSIVWPSSPGDMNGLSISATAASMARDEAIEKGEPAPAAPVAAEGTAAPPAGTIANPGTADKSGAAR